MMIDRTGEPQARRKTVDAPADGRLPIAVSLLVIGGLSALSWMALIAIVIGLGAML
jgi:hypothetical protein